MAVLADAAERRTPAAIRKELARYGGLNTFGRPHWRIVLAEDRLVRRGGVFVTMPSGKVSQVEVDPKTFQMHHREVKPEKVETGYLDVPKYPVKGWILERWFPASFYGTRSTWEAVKSSDGVTPMMGPYPQEGEYFLLGGPWEHIPEMHDLKTAISMHIRQQESERASYESVLRELITEDEEAYAKKVKQYQADIAHFYQSEVHPIRTGTSLEASRIRQELSRDMGDWSHAGIA